MSAGLLFGVAVDPPVSGGNRGAFNKMWPVGD